MRAYPDVSLTHSGNPFYTLVRSIVGQQISVKAAESVWGRLELLLSEVTPQVYLKLAEDSLRNCGLSRQKIGYIRNIAEALENGILTPDQWSNMSDQEVSQQLIKVKGIGQWTAQMFLIFYLHRQDIFPLADLGLVNAIQKLYGQEKSLDRVEMIELSARWQPFRTVATWYLWRSLDPVVVQY
jgi:DNA-3-methyladenine glycosylase II